MSVMDPQPKLVKEGVRWSPKHITGFRVEGLGRGTAHRNIKFGRLDQC